MPTYAYSCKQCGSKTEIIHKITEQPRKTCPACNQETLERGPGGGVGLSFIGNGFYGNDYKKNSAPVGESTDQPASSPSASSSCCPCGKNSCDK